MSGAHERHLHCVVLVYPKPTRDGECGGGWGLSYRDRSPEISFFPKSLSAQEMAGVQ